MRALKAVLLALLTALGSAQSPSCIDTDATVCASLANWISLHSEQAVRCRSAFLTLLAVHCAQFIEVVDVLETVMSNSMTIKTMMDPLMVRLVREVRLHLGSASVAKICHHPSAGRVLPGGAYVTAVQRRIRVYPEPTG